MASATIAADGGAALALEAGMQPMATIGDLDSLSPSLAAQLDPDRVFRISEQDSTDFDKALRHIRAPLVIGLGFLGERLDHQLAALHSLSQRCDQPCILIGAHEIALLAPPQMALPVAAGDIVSLFPLETVRVTCAALQWPLDDLTLAPGRKIGTSNLAREAGHLSVDVPGLFVILPKPRLVAVMQAVLLQPARWPARA